MYMSIRQYPIVREAREEILRRAREEFVPIVSGIPGLVSYHVMDPGDGTVVTVSVFRAREGADESDRRAADWARDHLGELVTGPPQIIRGPVVTADT